MPQTFDRALLFRYLLDRLAPLERESIEEEFFKNGVLFEEVEAVEDDLIDLYVLGRLSAEDRGRFETVLLDKSNRIRQRVANAQALQSHIRKQKSPLTRERSWRPRIAVVAAILVIVLGAVTWKILHVAPPTSRVQAPPRKVSQPPLEIALNLKPGTTRASGSLPEIEIPVSDASLVLHLMLDQAETAPLTALIETPEGKKIWRKEHIQPDGLLLIVHVPAAALPPNDYVVRVSTNAGEPVTDYVFRVARH